MESPHLVNVFLGSYLAVKKVMTDKMQNSFYLISFRFIKYILTKQD